MAAASTDAQVCNIALALTGSRQFLDRLDEVSAEAEACRRLFGPVRNELLEAWPWRFAEKTQALALTNEERDGWGFCYAMPSDCLKARRIWSGERRPGAGGLVAFGTQLNDAGTGRLICTDMEQASLVYTAEVTAIGLWPAHFVKAVAAALAVPLAAALTAKPGAIMPMLQQGADAALRRAAALDASEAEADPEPDSEWIRERG